MRVPALTGPTASGKTALSLQLAGRLGLEIVCMDSMQIYKEMNIGTAKPTEEERAAVPHHMVDLVPFYENYNAECYKADALSVIKEIYQRGKTPLLVGGTGLYADTLASRGNNAAPPSDREYIDQRLALLKTQDDIHAVWERLREVDPKSAEAIHENNVKRVLRALEIYEKSGKTKTFFDEASRCVQPETEIGMVTLDFHSRDALYERIDRRVDAMMEEGLLGEVELLSQKGLFDTDVTAAQAIGYKELGEYLSGRLTLGEATEAIKLATRRYAKRQLTWFRHRGDAYRLFVDTEDGRMRPMEELVSEAETVIVEFIKNNTYTKEK